MKDKKEVKPKAEAVDLNIPADFPLCTNNSILILESSATETVTEMNIILPAAVTTGKPGETRTCNGTIVGMGPLVDVKVPCPENDPRGMITEIQGKKNWYRNVELGDNIIFNGYADCAIPFKGRNYIRASADDIFYVYPDKSMIWYRGEKIDRRRAAVALKESEIAGKGSGEAVGMKAVKDDTAN